MSLVKKPEGYEEELREFQEAGILEIQQTRDGRQINFTEEGKALTDLKIAWDEDMQLFLFKIYWDDKYGSMENSVEKLFKIAKELKEDPGINILRTLEANQEKIHGIEFKEGYLPEDIVKQFDPGDSKTLDGEEQE